MLKLFSGKKRKAPLVRSSGAATAEVATILKQVSKVLKTKVTTYREVGRAERTPVMRDKAILTPWEMFNDLMSGKLDKNMDVIAGSGFGVPGGRILEVYGPESSGKTTLALQIIAAAQEAGRTAAFIDAEHAMDANYARLLGVDLDNLIFDQPDSGEKGLELLKTLAKKGVNVVAFDSVASIDPEAEQSKVSGKYRPGSVASLMSQACRQLVTICGKTGTTVIFLNQLREKIGVMFGNPEKTTGGNALKFYSSIRIDLRRQKILKKGIKAVGSLVRVRTVKNKVSPPFRELIFKSKFGLGFVSAMPSLKDYDAKGGD